MIKNKSGLASLQQNTSNSLNTEEKFAELSSLVIQGRVSDIILDETHPKFEYYGGWGSIGLVEFKKVYNVNEIDSNISIALPFLPNTKNYPLVNEIIYLLKAPTKDIGRQNNVTTYYYLSSINLWNNPHHNAYPNPNFTTPEDIFNSPYTSKSFIERDNIRSLKSFPGDYIIEGRWGNSIRLGSTSQDNSKYKNNWSEQGNNGDPITIIRNGQFDINSNNWEPIVEDINKDGSSTYYTSNQKIPLTNTYNNYKSLREKPISLTEYNKAQIIHNSKRIILNTTEDNILLNSTKDIGLSSKNNIGLSSEKEITLDSNNVKLGSLEADQAIIRGNDFMEDFKTLLESLENVISVLENSQIYPGGAGVPDTVLNMVASNTKNTIVKLKNKIEGKNPLLSKTSKTI